MKGFDDMKKIYEILSGIGLTVTDEQKKDFEKNFKEAYTSKADFDRLTAESDNYKSQLETAQTALQKFDGIDVDNLKNEIQKLTADLQKKENEYQTKLADMEFNNSLDNAITASGARNLKAVRALLDVDTLKASKNRDADIKNAIAAVKSENDYMFTAEHKPFAPVNPVDVGSGKKMTLSEAMAYANAHPNTDITTLI